VHRGGVGEKYKLAERKLSGENGKGKGLVERVSL